MGSTIDKMTGKAKQAAGNVTDDEQLKAKGKIQETKGKVEEVTDHAIKNLSDKIKK